MRLICLDLSVACTGVAVGYSDQAPEFTSLKKQKDEAIGASMRRLADFLELVIGKGDNPIVYAEASINPGAFLGEYDPAAGKVKAKSNPWTTIALAKMSATAELTTRRAGVEYREATVQQIRTAFLGKGTIKRDEAKRRAFELCKLLGWAPHNRDEADAGALFYYAATIVDPKHCRLVTPMQQMKVANTIGGVEIDDADALLRKRGLR
jgi:hypothetical protein